MLTRMFNRLIVKTFAYKGLLSLYEGELERSNYYLKLIDEADAEIDDLKDKIAKLKKGRSALRRELSEVNEAFGLAVSDKYRAIGASVALSDEVAHLRACLDSTEYLQESIADQLKALEDAAGSPGWAVKMLAKSFAETMGNAGNFVTTVVSHPDYGDFEYMVRRVNGKTVGEWAAEATCHLNNMLSIVGSMPYQSDDSHQAYADAYDWLEASEKLTHDFATRKNEVVAELSGVKTEFEKD